jgi:hypothetical protein
MRNKTATLFRLLMPIAFLFIGARVDKVTIKAINGKVYLNGIRFTKKTPLDSVFNILGRPDSVDYGNFKPLLPPRVDYTIYEFRKNELSLSYNNQTKEWTGISITFFGFNPESAEFFYEGKKIVGTMDVKKLSSNFEISTNDGLLSDTILRSKKTLPVLVELHGHVTKGIIRWVSIEWNEK